MYRKVKTDYADYIKQLKEWGEKYGMRYVKEHFEKRQKSFLFDNTNMQKR